MKFRVLKLLLLTTLVASAQNDMSYDEPSTGNPIIPGYFADPTVKKFGDDYYIYATTDGSGAGFGPAQLWTSRDFVNWTLMPMNWPDSHWIWAPDVMLNENDGRYYYVYCQPCQLHAGVGDTPRGPWINILGDSEAVLVPDRFVTNAITLDGQTFVDDDGSIYMYWGTWGIFDGFGCGAGKLTSDMRSFTETRLIPNTEVTDFFEAPFVLKRDSTYYFMYSSASCHDATYHVQYATAKSPLGPYEYKGAILKTNADSTIHGPGHHSVLQRGDDYFIVYHRHDNPHSNRGFHRQIAADTLRFLPDGSIAPVPGSHRGIGALAPLSNTSPNIALGAKVSASSFYDDNFKPEFAVDDNNGTLWRPAGMGQEWIELDLGKTLPIETVMTQWEYGTQFYQYLIETSVDGNNWTVFADKRDNRLAGSPMVDFGDTKARYIRITFTGGQKRGFPGAIWNIKVFSTTETFNPQQWISVSGRDWNGTRWLNRNGQLGGYFDVVKGRVTRLRHDGQECIELMPGTEIRFDNRLIDPKSNSTLVLKVWDGEKWINSPITKIQKGKLTVESGNQPLIVSNLQYYNWKLEPSEIIFALSNDVVPQQAAPLEPMGKLIDISADCLAPMQRSDTVWFIPNQGVIGGEFVPQQKPLKVVEIEGKKAFLFDGTTPYMSSFPLPATVRDNTPYTLEMEILNPEIQLNECVADFTSSHDELEKIMAVNGTEPRCGVMNHYGWYEDAGWPQVESLAGKWQNVKVVFDGRIEKVYINGQLVSEKDIQLLVKPSQFVMLGLNAEGEWPFTGYLRSLTFYDEAIE